MTAPRGSIVKLYVDLTEAVNPTDVIETRTGRRYWVLAVRTQDRGKHRGRQHLACLVLGPEETDKSAGTNRVHRIRWYARHRASGGVKGQARR